MKNEKDKETMKEKMHDAGEKIKEKGHELKEDIKHGAEKVKEKAHELKEDIKTKAKNAKAKQDLKENEKNEHHKKKEALKPLFYAQNFIFLYLIRLCRILQLLLLQIFILLIEKHII